MRSKLSTAWATATKRAKRAAPTDALSGALSWRPSALTIRIAAFNLVALVVLVGGVLYLSEFRKELIDQKLRSLQIQAEMIGVVLADAAGEPDSRRFDHRYATEVLRRVAQPTGLRAQLFDTGARLNVDTRRAAPLQVDVVEILPDRTPLRDVGDNLTARIQDLGARLLSIGSAPPNAYVEVPLGGIAGVDRRWIYEAIEGKVSAVEFANSEGELILSVFMPVRRVHTVIGVLVLDTKGGDIDKLVAKERQAILQIAVAALVVGVFLSAALANTIARPIRALADAADDAKGDGPNSALARATIPDFSNRGDEIGELSIALRRMTHALYERIEANETFAADVAHEIRNPLTSLRSAVQTLDAVNANDEARRNLLAVIAHDVTRLDRLVTDISNASRLDAELVREQREAFDLRQLLSNIVQSCQFQADDRGVALRLDAPEGEVRLRGMEGRLAQVFVNLIQNAISFSPAGGALVVSLRMVKRDGAQVRRIEVVDEGPGIPPDNLESIFERFYSERPDTEAFGGHSGLGLNIARQIVDAHGGRIWAENRADRSGARFIVALTP